MRIEIVTTKCKRCGKQIASMSQPVYSSQATMNKWRGICKDCVSDAERFQMMQDMNEDVKEKMA